MLSLRIHNSRQHRIMNYLAPAYIERKIVASNTSYTSLFVNNEQEFSIHYIAPVLFSELLLYIYCRHKSTVEVINSAGVILEIFYFILPINSIEILIYNYMI
jgi:hypothetical protein